MSDSSSLDPELHRNHKRKRTHTDLDKNPPTDCIDMFDTLETQQEQDAMDVVDAGAKESPSKEDGDKEEEDENPKTLIVRFLKEHTVYATMPTSSKVLVLDVEVPLRLAFFALVENSASSAPIWDRKKGFHVGLLSPSEFLTVLLYFYPSRTYTPHSFIINHHHHHHPDKHTHNRYDRQKSLESLTWKLVESTW